MPRWFQVLTCFAAPVFRRGGSYYLITPAHVAIFVKEGKWVFSKFLDDFKGKDWRIHYSYTTNPSPQNDICWAKVDDDHPDALDLAHSVLCDPTKIRVIFRQPYDMDALGEHPLAFFDKNSNMRGSYQIIRATTAKDRRGETCQNLKSTRHRRRMMLLLESLKQDLKLWHKKLSYIVFLLN